MYEQAIQHYERSGGETGWAPIPPHVDDDRFAMQIASRLGISALEVRHVPLHWVGSAAIQLEAESLEQRRAMRQAEQARKKQAPRRRS